MRKKVKKQNQIKHYLVLIFVGVVLVLVAIGVTGIPTPETPTKTNIISILISIGCGLFTSVVVSWLCEYNNQKNENEKRKKMKHVLLDGFKETIEVNLQKEAVEYEDVALVIQTDFITHIPERIKEFLLIGAFLYSENELKYLMGLRASATGLINIVKQNKIRELFSKYETVFYSIKEKDLDHGPYAECERKIKEICARQYMEIDERTACMIGEFFYSYYIFIIIVRQFSEVFGFEK